MILNKVEFNKFTQDRDGEKFEFRYEGIANDNINQEEIQIIIDKFMNQINHENMKTNIKFLRTILKDCEEKLLVLNYQDDKNEIHIKFVNCHLFSYEKIEKQNDNNESIIIKYNPSKDIKITVSAADNKITEYSNARNFGDKMTKFLTEINDLSKAKSIELNDNSKILIEIYKCFYNEIPDFSDKLINIKMQTMVSILIEFGISINDDYYFSLYGKKNMPMSLVLYDHIYNLFPFGKIEGVDYTMKLRDDVKKRIITIGNTIRAAIKDIDNKAEALITISKAVYAARYDLSYVKSIGDISKYTDCSNNDLEFSMKLVKNINTKIHNQQ